jgi:hypothetical protein
MLSQFSHTDRGSGEVGMTESAICTFSQEGESLQLEPFLIFYDAKPGTKTISH